MYLKSEVSVKKEDFGSFENIQVFKFCLVNANGAELHLISYGAAIQGIRVPDREGQLADVVLGFNDLEGYLGVRARNPYFGASVGRVANRISEAKFNLDGQEYKVAANNGRHGLHGGIRSFSRVAWNNYIHKDGRVTFTYLSPDKEEGYPGDLMAQVTYKLGDDNEVEIHYRAVTSHPTPVNLCNHAYFNLAGHGAGADGGVYDHVIELNADSYTPTDDELIPTGEIRGVDGSPFDLRQPTRMGDVIGLVQGGYDHNYVVDKRQAMKFKQTLTLVAKVKHPQTGRVMEVFSDQPGFQFYSGNFLPTDGSLVGKADAVYKKHGGFCIETQNFPNAVNQPNFPDSVLQPGAVYETTSVYKFSQE